MRIVCSWCQKEGKAEFVGEKAPLDDRRETHGICVIHRHHIEAGLQTMLRTDFPLWSLEQTVKTATFIVKWRGVLNVTEILCPSEQGAPSCRFVGRCARVYPLNILSNWSIPPVSILPFGVTLSITLGSKLDSCVLAASGETPALLANWLRKSLPRPCLI